MRENFQVETFDKKEDRDRRFEELRGKHPAIVRFSGNRPEKSGDDQLVRILPNYAGRLVEELFRRNEKQLVHGRMRLAFVSTWSVAWPIELPPPRGKVRSVPGGPSPKRRRRDERFRLRHNGKTRESLRKLLRTLNRKSFNRQNLPQIVKRGTFGK